MLRPTIEDRVPSSPCAENSDRRPGREGEGKERTEIIVGIRIAFRIGSGSVYSPLMIFSVQLDSGSRMERIISRCADKRFFKEETEALPPSGRFEIRDGGSRGRMNPERKEGGADDSYQEASTVPGCFRSSRGTNAY